MNIRGMATEEDAAKALQALEAVWGVREAKVDLAKGQASVSYDESATSFEDFQQVILESGFDITKE